MIDLKITDDSLRDTIKLLDKEYVKKLKAQIKLERELD